MAIGVVGSRGHVHREYGQRPNIRETLHSALNLRCLFGHIKSELLGGAAISSHCYQLVVDCSST